ncbi:MAG: presqualene diphosphate synthase HpnD [Deltaproteobacteria bacterium]|nr:presqualene diphosphate synthase HpnD [Deltaproteobacteria bacterium]
MEGHTILGGVIHPRVSHPRVVHPGAVRRSNFYLSLFFLPPRKRKAMTAIYSFARLVDDIVDEEGEREEKERELQFWREEIKRCLEGAAQTPLGRELSLVIQGHQLSEVYFQELINGVAMDLSRDRYATFEELCGYCYGVAGTVGSICMELFGLRHERAMEYAKTLGRAFQLTNILRDIIADLEQNRVYLPQEDLRRFGVTEEDLRGHRDSDAFRTLIGFEVQRAFACFQQVQGLLTPEEKRKIVAADVMGAVYSRILREIAKSPSRIFREKVSLDPVTKLSLALQTWFKNQFTQKGRGPEEK